jgi:MFS family permease
MLTRYFMFTYITTTTIPSFAQIQKLYNINYSEVNWTVGAPSIGLAFGPLIWSSLSDIYGRRIIFIVGTTIAFFATIGTAISKTYGAYMVARFFQGLGASPGGTVGMAIVNEYVYQEEITVLQLTNGF